MSHRATDFNPKTPRRAEQPRRAFAFPAEPGRRSEPEPITPVVQKPQAPKGVYVRLPRPGLKVLAAIVAIVVAVAAVVIFVARPGGHDPLPADIKKEANFTLYYPKKVPEGFHFDNALYDASTHVVTYDYTTNDGNKLYFSLQPKPSNFNFDNFNKKQLSGAHQTDTPIGAATIGILQQETVSSVVTDKTWVLISAGEKVSLDQLEQVSKSLTPVDR